MSGPGGITSPRALIRHLAGRILAGLALGSVPILLAPARAVDLHWQQGAGFRSAPVVVAADGKTGFTQLEPRDTGLHFTNRLAEILALNDQILENGAGIALGDVDGDGQCDVYLCGAENPNKLLPITIAGRRGAQGLDIHHGCGSFRTNRNQ